MHAYLITKCFKVQKKSDVWALGCILYNMVYGRTPYQNYMNAIQKTHAIVHKPITFQEIEDKELLDVMKVVVVDFVLW